MFRMFSIIVFLITTSNAVALDSSDVGTFAVVHRDGHVTDFTFYVSLSGDTWNIEQKKPDGSWANVTCQQDCILRKSKQQDISRFFSVGTLAKIAPSCVHNTAFAFCSYTMSSQENSKVYLLIALVTPQPTLLKLKRLSDARGDRAGS